jgi:hypothetical protein
MSTPAGRVVATRSLVVRRSVRSTRDLLNTLAAITAKKVGFKSLGDTWADTQDIARAVDADRARRPRRGSNAILSAPEPAKAGREPWRAGSE